MKANLKIKISNMKCGSCVSLIKTTLEEIDGISEIDIDLASATANIEYDSSVINDTKIITTKIEELNFNVENII